MILNANENNLKYLLFRFIEAAASIAGYREVDIGVRMKYFDYLIQSAEGNVLINVLLLIDFILFYFFKFWMSPIK